MMFQRRRHMQSDQRRQSPGERRVHLDQHIGQRLVLDRKSTRLNSSHMSISYAVFCLKKKKTRFFSLHVKDGKLRRRPPAPWADCQHIEPPALLVEAPERTVGIPFLLARMFVRQFFHY